MYQHNRTAQPFGQAGEALNLTSVLGGLKGVPVPDHAPPSRYQGELLHNTARPPTAYQSPRPQQAYQARAPVAQMNQPTPVARAAPPTPRAALPTPVTPQQQRPPTQNYAPPVSQQQFVRQSAPVNTNANTPFRQPSAPAASTSVVAHTAPVVAHYQQQSQDFVVQQPGAYEYPNSVQDDQSQAPASEASFRSDSSNKAHVKFSGQNKYHSYNSEPVSNPPPVAARPAINFNQAPTPVAPTNRPAPMSTPFAPAQTPSPAPRAQSQAPWRNANNPAAPPAAAPAYQPPQAAAPPRSAPLFSKPPGANPGMPLGSRKAVGESAVTLASMLGQASKRKEAQNTSRPIFEMALVDREAEVGEPAVFEVRVRNARASDSMASVQWYYNSIPVREDLDRDIRILALDKSQELTVYTLVLGEFQSGYQGRYEVQINNKYGQNRCACNVRAVSQGTLERERLANQDLVGNSASAYYQNMGSANPTGKSPAIQQVGNRLPGAPQGARIQQSLATGEKVISSNNVGLYSNQNIGDTYSRFAYDNSLPTASAAYGQQQQPQCQGYASDVMNAISDGNHTADNGQRALGKTHQYLQRNYQ